MPVPGPKNRKLSPRKRPQQERSKAMVAAILEAAIRVLVTRGYEGTTTIAVAQKAGVSVGSLYQYFPNKEAIVLALVEQHAQEIVACTDAAFARAAGSSPREVLRSLIHAGIEAHRVNPALHKVLSEQVPRIGRVAAAMQTSKIITERLARYLTAHRHHLGARDPQVAAFVVETVVEALTHRAVLERPEALGAGDVEQEALQLVMGYLFGAPPPSSPELVSPRSG